MFQNNTKKQKITSLFWKTVIWKCLITFSFLVGLWFFFCQQNMYSSFGAPIPPLPPLGICSTFPVIWLHFHFPSSVWTQCPIIPSNTCHLFHFSMRYISSFNFKVSMTRLSPHLVSDTAYEPKNSNLRHKLCPFVLVLTTLGLSWSKLPQALLCGLSPSTTKGDCHN